MKQFYSMASVYEKPSVPLSGIVQTAEQLDNSDTDQDNIPYHARENALPFTYGNVPEGFDTSDLNHVDGNVCIDALETKMVENKNPETRSYTIRKTVRPSISASCPLVRKTPSRQEFEHMLMERKGHAVHSDRDFSIKLAHDETIQKDLDELQKRLNRPYLDIKEPKETQVGSMELSDAESGSSTQQMNPQLQLVENKRSKTPTFPFVQRPFNSERCVSPYPTPNISSTPMVNDNSASEQDNRNLRHIGGISLTKEVEPRLVKFAKDSSQFWYKPNMSREEAVDLLRDAVPGTFLIRNSTTYRNAFGLVLRVAKPPSGMVTGPEYGDQLVRHFLIEPTTRGVRLMGCTNEPIFTSLSAFVYEHSINQMSLACTLKIPDKDLLLISNNEELILKQKQMLAQGAACNVLYLFQGDMESLTGDDAVRKAVLEMNSEPARVVPLEVHLKISEQGITLTDNTRTKFFRRHYPSKNISHLCMDPGNHFWSVPAANKGLEHSINKSIFAFIARPLTGSKDNQCHIFCDISPMQPASAIVSFAHKVLPLDNSNCKML